MPDVIETERLRLRPFAEDLSDLDALHEIQSDPEHMRFYPHPFSREESRAWIEKFLERQVLHGYSLWAIEDRETGEFLGNCGPVPQMVDEIEEVELGWSVTPRRARQGIATEAAAAWRDRCLGPLGMDHVIALIRPENVPSRGVAEHIGMTVWKETRHGGLGWLHLVYRIDAGHVPSR
ncbi:MAG TPA: GNAT family N-acetyltransferase [Actinomycetota bacterium]|nr:GNAT family N-acetyltransferase [Actinomycetota bacterium]